MQEYQEAEQTRIYHHELHQKRIKRTSILRLQTDDGLLEGHNLCAKYLETQVGKLLLSPAVLCASSQKSLLNELEPVVTVAENDALSKMPTKTELFDVLKDSNLNSAPGFDGISSQVYYLCWDCLGDALTELAIARF